MDPALHQEIPRRGNLGQKECVARELSYASRGSSSLYLGRTERGYRPQGRGKRRGGAGSLANYLKASYLYPRLAHPSVGYIPYIKRKKAQRGTEKRKREGSKEAGQGDKGSHRPSIFCVSTINLTDGEGDRYLQRVLYFTRAKAALSKLNEGEVREGQQEEGEREEGSLAKVSDLVLILHTMPFKSRKFISNKMFNWNLQGENQSAGGREPCDPDGSEQTF